MDRSIIARERANQSRSLQARASRRVLAGLLLFLVTYGGACATLTYCLVEWVIPGIFGSVWALGARFVLGIWSFLAFVGLVLGLYLVAKTGIRYVVRRFDELFSAMADVAGKREGSIALPRGLEPAQEVLNALKEEAEQNERAAAAAEERKDELVAYLAHDIKTPLTSIIGYLALLDESPDLPGDIRRRYIATALSKSYRLEELMSDFFEITRYNLQTIPIERSSFDGALFVNQIIDELYPVAQARGLQVVYDGPASFEVFADASHVARVLNNVLRNALAYADARTEVRVRTSLTVGQGNFLWWELTVTDKGRELSPEHIERIFERFFRADDARPTATGGGAGLGLAIAREITRAHGGDIYVQSAAGITSFTVWIPQGAVVSGEPSQA